MKILSISITNFNSKLICIYERTFPSLILLLTFLAYVGLAILMLFLWIVSVMFSDGYIDGIESEIPEYEAPKVSPENIPLPKQTEKVLGLSQDTAEFYDQTDYILDLNH